MLTDAYKHLRGIQILFDSYNYFLPYSFKGISHVIHNPIYQVNNDEIVNHSNAKEKYKIINIASLVTSCKQQDIVIKIFSNLANKYPNWDLYFWGEGNDKENLENLIQKLNLGNRVFLCGFTPNPIEELKKSDLFIFPSKYEGFPLALAEAMSVGLPVVGFSNCSGVNELIIDNQSGFLCNSNEHMQNNIEKLILDSELRKKFGLVGHNQMLAYTEKLVTEKWKSLIDTVYNKK
ncbi:glycosyltransferase [Flavobacterium psychrophilum]|uniref:glycosyltransferase n=1 Tax=Flavobacterium psychrophilum TaxID=96345 RepID=UPI000B8ECE23|nr:glycosyltransferase [Flavobacterium psychrophilum]